MRQEPTEAIGACFPVACYLWLARLISELSNFVRVVFLMDASAKLNALLAEARMRLIETGTRNRLVHTNRRAKRPSTLAILQDDADGLFRRLVSDGAALRFRSDPRITARGGEEHEEGIDEDCRWVRPRAPTSRSVTVAYWRIIGGKSNRPRPRSASLSSARPPRQRPPRSANARLMPSAAGRRDGEG
jgi:hypothetical protein